MKDGYLDSNGRDWVRILFCNKVPRSSLNLESSTRPMNVSTLDFNTGPIRPEIVYGDEQDESDDPSEDGEH